MPPPVPGRHRTRDRLNEISFDLRLGEGGRRATVADMGRVMLAHLDPADPLRTWADGMAGGLIDVELAGHLTGSIDLILRIADGAASVSWWPTTRPTR